jgi:hypothetical protein
MINVKSTFCLIAVVFIVASAQIEGIASAGSTTGNNQKLNPDCKALTDEKGNTLTDQNGAVLTNGHCISVLLTDDKGNILKDEKGHFLIDDGKLVSTPPTSK